MPDEVDRPIDVWVGGSAYESYVGRWSRMVAPQFLAWLAVPSAGRWLDVGCGTGALSETILAVADPSYVKGVDPSEGYIDFARDHIRDTRAAFAVIDGRTLDEPSARYDAVVSGLVLNFVTDPGHMLTEMVRILRPGGRVGAYVWDYAGEMQFMRHFWDAAVSLDPMAGELDEGQRFPVCRPDRLESLFRGAGLEDVRVRDIDIPTDFRDFEDFWQPFLGGQGPAPGYVMSLGEDRRTALREHLRSRIPAASDGSIHLIARAWAVSGRL